MKQDDRAALAALLRERSVRTGDFVLASGAHSTYYIDARLTTMSGAGQVLIGRLALAAIDDAGWNAELVGGLTMGADPVSCAIVHAAALAGRTLDAFTVRKEPKVHGTGKLIEGPFNQGARVVVCEDTITSGGSALRAIEAIDAAGGTVLGVITIVDRGEGATERLAEEGYEIRSLFTAQELIEA